jgi:Zn-dependent peptidase ImmA (M78 family)
LIESGIVDDTMYRSELGSVYETQANQLAADILMPIRLVKKWRQTLPDEKDLAKKFDVSEQAMKIRLKGMVPA